MTASMWGEKEDRLVAEISVRAAVLRSIGGECDCGSEVGVFRIDLNDGRVFRKAGLHGSGGAFRLDAQHREDRERRRKLTAQVHAHIERSRGQTQHRELTIYLAYQYVGSETLRVMPEDIKTIEIDEGP